MQDFENHFEIWCFVMHDFWNVDECLNNVISSKIYFYLWLAYSSKITIYFQVSLLSYFGICILLKSLFKSNDFQFQLAKENTFFLISLQLLYNIGFELLVQRTIFVKHSDQISMFPSLILYSQRKSIFFKCSGST